MPDTAPFVGFTTGPAIDSPDQQSLIGTMPSTVADRFSADLWHDSRELLDWSERGQALGGRSGVRAPITPETTPMMVPKDQLEEKYGIAGTLKFDQDMPEAVAQNLYEGALDRLRREDVYRRAPSGFLPGAARIGASFVASALDPLDMAANFIPVVGEARYARWLAQAGGAAGRTAVRAGVGALRGVAGNIPIVAMHYGISGETQEDYTAVDALVDLAYGAALGGALHTALGPFTERGMINEARARLAREGLPGATEPTPLSQAIAAAPLEVREGAMRSAISAGAEDRPVASADVLHTAGVALPEESRGPIQLIGKTADEAEATVNQMRVAEDRTLLEVLGSPEEVAQYRRLDRLRMDSSDSVANHAQAEFDQRYGSLPKEQLDRLDDIGAAEDAARVAKALRRTDAHPDLGNAQIAETMAKSLIRLERSDIEAVHADRAEYFQQEEFARFAQEYAELRRRGLSESDIRGEGIAALKRNGYGKDAEEVFDRSTEALKGGQTPRTRGLPAPEIASRTAENMRAASEPPLGLPGTPLKDPADAAVQREAEALAPKGGPRTQQEIEPAQQIKEAQEKLDSTMVDLGNALRVSARAKPAKVARPAGQRAPQTLAEFLAARGGVKDTRDELKAIGADVWHRGKMFQKKLVSEKGADLDYAREAAEEAGYLQPGSTVNDLLDALGEEVRGNPRYRDSDLTAVQDLGARRELVAEIDRMGEDATHWTDEQIHEFLTAHAEAADLDYAQSALDDEIGRETSDLLAGLEDRTIADEIPFEPVGHVEGARGGAEPPFGLSERPGAVGEGAPTGAEGAAREGTGGEVPTVEAGGQTVLPGAEKISDRTLAERTMAKPMRGGKPQKAADEGLFDIEARQQQDMIDQLLAEAQVNGALSEEDVASLKGADDLIAQADERAGVAEIAGICAAKE